MGRTTQPSCPALLGCPAAACVRACVRVGVLLMHLLPVFCGGWCAMQAGLGLTYLFAGRQLVTGNPRLGYDLGTVSSLALVSGYRLHSAHAPVQIRGLGARRLCGSWRQCSLSTLCSKLGGPQALRVITDVCAALPLPLQVGVAGPRARATQEMSSVAMAALGGEGPHQTKELHR